MKYRLKSKAENLGKNLDFGTKGLFHALLDDRELPACEENEETEDNVAGRPKRNNKSRSKCSADRAAGAGGVARGVSDLVPDILPIDEQPKRHQRVEGNEQPFEDLPEQAAPSRLAP
jgi:hypothetical protein